MSCNCEMKGKNNHRNDCNPDITCSCFTCNCPDRLREETQLKCCWEENSGEEERIFASPGVCRMIATGTITYDCTTTNPTGKITIRFYRGDAVGGTVVQEAIIEEGSCLTFVAQNFNTITVQRTTGAGPAQGEICITPNFKIPCN